MFTDYEFSAKHMSVFAWSGFTCACCDCELRNSANYKFITKLSIYSILNTATSDVQLIQQNLLQ